jgi:hypothetical protein
LRYAILLNKTAAARDFITKEGRELGKLHGA